jgi:hypothetical protein
MTNSVAGHVSRLKGVYTTSLNFTATNSQAPLPAGVYAATLETIEERQGVNGAYLRWCFHIETDGREISVGALSSVKFSPTAKARQFAEVLLGRALAPGEEIDLAALFGRACRVVLTVGELDDHSTVNRVETLLPAEQDVHDAGVPF